MAIKRYSELTPENLPLELAIQPWGALEWHGPHLPLGLDGIVAEAFVDQLAETVGGVVLPTQYNSMTTLPHQASLQISTVTFRELVRELLRGLASVGFKKIALVTGHYAQGHMVELYESAIWAIERTGIPVLVGTPLEPIGVPDLLDHAGRFEASQLLKIRPDLVGIEKLVGQINAKSHAVLGESPVNSSREEGEDLITRGVQGWVTWIEEPGDLYAHYQAAIGQYDSYRESFFKDSWEQAIKDWWATKT